MLASVSQAAHVAGLDAVLGRGTYIVGTCVQHQQQVHPIESNTCRAEPARRAQQSCICNWPESC
jgi:hypothetical protein